MDGGIKMDFEQAKAKLINLRKELELHNYQYYVLDAPTISDAKYDRLMQELIAIEKTYPQLVTPDSPSQRVGGEVLNVFTSYHHRKPLLSLANAFKYI